MFLVRGSIEYAAITLPSEYAAITLPSEYTVQYAAITHPCTHHELVPAFTVAAATLQYGHPNGPGFIIRNHNKTTMCTGL